MSTNSIHINVHSYVYFNTYQNISCSILHLVSFKGFVDKCTVNLKRGQVKIQTNCRKLLKIGLDLSFSVVVVCILRVAFFSSRLDLVDHY